MDKISSYLPASAAEGLLKLIADGVTFFQRPEKSPLLCGSVGEGK